MAFSIQLVKSVGETDDRHCGIANARAEMRPHEFPASEGN